MKLIALQQIHDPVGTIAAGQVFHADEKNGLRLIESAKASLPETRHVWPALVWTGATVVVIASGPSLTPADCDLVKSWRNGLGLGCLVAPDRRAIVINTSYQLAPWADILYACDGRWWEHYYNQVRDFAGQLWTQDEPASRKFERLHYVRSESKPGLNKLIGVINQGQNGGHQAVGLAYQAGASKVVLLGFDMGEGGGHSKLHWHPDHPARLHSFPQYEVWVRNFEVLARDLKVMGVELVNASRRSALRNVPKVLLEEALR